MNIGEITFYYNNTEFSLHLHPYLEVHEAPRYCLHNLYTDMVISENIFTVAQMFSELEAFFQEE